MCNIYCVSRCVSVLVEECVGQLCEPSLSQSAAEERQEATRAKKTVHLLKILAELTPAQFASPEVFQNLLSLLRHDDSEIGGCCQWVWSRYIYIYPLIGKLLKEMLFQLINRFSPRIVCVCENICNICYWHLIITYYSCKFPTTIVTALFWYIQLGILFRS